MINKTVSTLTQEIKEVNKEKSFKYGSKYNNLLPMSDKQRYCSRYKHRLNNNPTKAELAFKDILVSLNLHFRKNKGFIKGAKTFCIADFYLPSPYMLVIEIDGEYHNSQKMYDEERTQYLASRNIDVIRFTNEEVLENPKEVIRLLKVRLCVRKKLKTKIRGVNAKNSLTKSIRYGRNTG